MTRNYLPETKLLKSSLLLSDTSSALGLNINPHHAHESSNRPHSTHEGASSVGRGAEDTSAEDGTPAESNDGMDYTLDPVSAISQFVEKLNNGKKRYRCKPCGQRFLTRAKAEQHVITHCKDANFKSRSFKELPSMEKNILVETLENSEELKPCHCLPSPSVPPSLKLSIISGGGNVEKSAFSNGSDAERGSNTSRSPTEQSEEYSDHNRRSFSEQDTTTRTAQGESDAIRYRSPSASATYGDSTEEEKDTLLPEEIEAAVVCTFRKIGFHIPNAKELHSEPELLTCKRCGEIEETKELLQKHINIGSFFPDRSLSNEELADAFCDVCNVHLCKGRTKHFIRAANHRDCWEFSAEEFAQLKCYKCRLSFTTRGEFVMHVYEVFNHLGRLNEGKDYRAIYAECPGNTLSREDIMIDGDYDKQMANWHFASEMSEYCVRMKARESSSTRHKSTPSPESITTLEATPPLQPTPPYSPCPEHLRRLHRLKSDESLKYVRLRDVEHIAEAWGEEEEGMSAVEKLNELAKGENRRKSL